LTMPKVEAALEKLRETTGVGFTRADTIANEHPGMNGIFVNEVPAWEVMDYIAAQKKVEGRWEKDGDGYRLVSNGNVAAIPEEVAKQAAAAPLNWWRPLIAIAVVLALAAGGVLLLLWRRATLANQKKDAA